MGSLVALLTRARPPDRRIADLMLESAAHRGTRSRSVVLGNCLLATGSQPDWDDTSLAERGGHAAAVVGQIDNLADLAAELGFSATLAEHQAVAVIEAFRVLGRDLPGRLRGAYAVAITDGASIVCFRDHLGFGKLFFNADDQSLVVASEAKQVIAATGQPMRPNLDVLERMFYENVDDESVCAIKGVKRLPAAVTLTYGAGRLETSRYWHPDRLLETAPSMSAAELQARFDALMARAVGRALTGRDVVTLSGGIDSPAVAAFAARDYARRELGPLHALSAEFPDHPTVDERRYVELIAERLGITVHFYRPSARPLGDLDRWVRLADGPFPTTSLAEAEEQYTLARDLGFRNLLTGELAEFLIDLRGNLVPHLIGRGRIRAAVGQLAAQRRSGARILPLIRQAAAGVVPSRLAVLYGRARMQPPRLPDWIQPPRWSRAYRRAAAPRDRWRQTQLSVFLGAGLSMEADECVQASCGVRVRRPWADVDLWEFFLSLPAEVKFPDARSKTLARRLLAGAVPDEILRRRSKTVFDDAVRANIDYDVLDRILSAPRYHVTGVDYAKLREHLARRDLDLGGFIWARDLAVVHTFLRQWEGKAMNTW